MDVDADDGDYLDNAVEDGNFKLVKELWPTRSNCIGYVDTALDHNQFEIAEWILQQDPTSVNRAYRLNYSWTPLMGCDTNKAVKLLLDYGADIFIKTDDQETALHIFCFYDLEINILPLLARGADERERDSIGHSALEYAGFAKHPQLGALENFRNLMVLAKRYRNQAGDQTITIPIDILRALKTFLF